MNMNEADIKQQQFASNATSPSKVLVIPENRNRDKLMTSIFYAAQDSKNYSELLPQNPERESYLKTEPDEDLTCYENKVCSE